MWGSGTAAVTRALFANGGVSMRQIDLAERARVTQPRVSQALVVVRRDAGMALAGNARDGCNRLAETYSKRFTPRATAADAFWYSLDPLARQVRAIVEARRDVVVSADTAADLLAAWRRPTLTAVYTLTPIDVASLGFVPAEGPGDATIVVRATDDARLIAEATVMERVPVAPLLQVFADLRRLGGSDREEAAQRLLTSALT